MTQIKRPSFLLATMEGRAFYELGAFCLSFPFMQAAPSGDGHPVIVFPGFMTSDMSTLPLRTFLSARNYTPYGWGLGRNLGRGIDRQNGVPRNAKSVKLLERVAEKHNSKVSLIGWSLGGIYAREIARIRPDLVRQVVTMGSPFNGKNLRASNVVELFEKISGNKIEGFSEELVQQIGTPPPVPSTAIYTRTDGIAAWQCCTEQETDYTENIGVFSSHTGLGHNPLVLWILADRLAQQDGQWRPFDRAGLKSLVYTTPQKPMLAW